MSTRTNGTSVRATVLRAAGTPATAERPSTNILLPLSKKISVDRELAGGSAYGESSQLRVCTCGPFQTMSARET